MYLEKCKWDSRKTEIVQTVSQEISRILDRITPVLSDETWKAWCLSMQLHLSLHAIPSSYEELSMALRQSPFSRMYAPGGINELTLLSTFKIHSGRVLSVDFSMD